MSLISLDHEWDRSAGFPLVGLDGLDRDGAFLDTAANDDEMVGYLHYCRPPDEQ